MSARRAGIVAGILVGLFVAASFLVIRVPDPIIGMFGGPTGLERTGGLRVHYRGDGGSTGTMEYPGVAEDMAHDLVATITGGGLKMREVVNSDLVKTVPLSGDVKLDSDMWQPESGGPRRSSMYLYAPSRKELESVVDAALRSGWSPTPGTEIAYEKNEDDTGGVVWRTYELRTEVLIDGSMIADAYRNFDPYTNRPIVLLDFTPEGGETFSEVTERVVGNKLAIMLGDRVRSAPIINTRIRGGRASIAMGGSDPRQQEREAEMLVSVLNQGGIPDRVDVIDSKWQPAMSDRTQIVMGAAAIGAIAGILVGILFGFVVRFAKPARAKRTIFEATPSRAVWKRVLVTLLAPVILIAGSFIDLPGVNSIELEWIAFRGGGGGGATDMSILQLGIAPIISSFILVELVALAIPRLRWRRHDAIGRIRLGQATAIVAMLVAAVQGYFIATYLEALSRGGAEVVIAPGLKFRLLVMLTLVGGTAILAVVAGMIREHGLGNGYGVVLLSGVVIGVVSGVVRDFPDVEAIIDTFSRYHLYGIAGVVVVAAGTWYLLRARTSDGSTEVSLRLPTSGVNPLGDSLAIIQLTAFVTVLSFGAGIDAAMSANAWLADPKIHLAILALSIPLWAWAFARPRVIEHVAMQAGVGVASNAAWLRGTALTGAVIVGIAGVRWWSGVADRGGIIDPITTMIAVAVVLDLVADFRAHRRYDLAPVAVLHQIQRAGVVDRLLDGAKLPHHIHSENLRSLTAFFGPWAPAIVMVPREHADVARARIADAMVEARAKVPVARTSIA